MAGYWVVVTSSSISSSDDIVGDGTLLRLTVLRDHGRVTTESGGRLDRGVGFTPAVRVNTVSDTTLSVYSECDPCSPSCSLSLSEKGDGFGVCG